MAVCLGKVIANFSSSGSGSAPIARAMTWPGGRAKLWQSNRQSVFSHCLRALATIKFLISCGVALAGSTAMIALGITRMLLLVPIRIGILCGLFSGVDLLFVYFVKYESIPHAIHWCVGSFTVAFTAIAVQAMTQIAGEWIGERVGRI
ncbi:MAG: hypothetical protein AB1448_04835 [Pseudomonadota bacterium]